VVKIVGAYAIETVKVFSFLASPFVKGGSRGIFINHRSLIFNDYCLIDPISPNPSLLKRGNNKNTFTASIRPYGVFYRFHTDKKLVYIPMP